MMRFFFFSLFLIATLNFAQAQNRFGIAAGTFVQIPSTYDLDLAAPDSSLIFRSKTPTEYRFGIFGRVGETLYLQAALFFSSTRLNYDVFPINQIYPSQTIGDSFFFLDMPVVIGLKSNAVRLQGGVMGNYFLWENSDLAELYPAAVTKKITPFSLSWIAGIGLDMGSLSLDINYIGQDRRVMPFSNETTVGNQTYIVDTKTDRIQITCGVSF